MPHPNPKNKGSAKKYIIKFPPIDKKFTIAPTQPEPILRSSVEKYSTVRTEVVFINTEKQKFIIIKPQIIRKLIL